MHLVCIVPWSKEFFKVPQVILMHSKVEHHWYTRCLSKWVITQNSWVSPWAQCCFQGPPDTAAPHSHSTKISECQDFCTTDLKEGNRRRSQHGCWASSLKLDLVWYESNSSVKANCFTGIQFVEPSIIPSFSPLDYKWNFPNLFSVPLILNVLLTFAFLLSVNLRSFLPRKRIQGWDDS